MISSSSSSSSSSSISLNLVQLQTSYRCLHPHPPWNNIPCNSNPLQPKASAFTGQISAATPQKVSSVQKLKRLVASRIHSEAMDLYLLIRSQGITPGVVLESMLIDLLMKSEMVDDAFLVFDGMPQRNVVSWTSMIAGCIKNGFQESGLDLFAEMIESGVLPNAFAFNAALLACTGTPAAGTGEQLHSLIIRSGLGDDSWTTNSLIDFYSRCGLIDRAKLVFDAITNPDVVSFTSLISGYCRNNLLDSAVRVFDRMLKRGLEPNEHTISCTLTACGSLLGEQIHGYMIKTMIINIVYSASSLIDFYSRNLQVKQAKLVFQQLETRNVVTWSSMIACCLSNEQLDEAFQMFNDMIASGIKPNEFTFSNLLGICGSSQESEHLGLQLHCSAMKHGLTRDIRVANALLTMYAKYGKMEELETVFLRIEEPDIISWTSVVSGNFQNGWDGKSIELICRMHREGYMPNEYALSSALSSCANLALLDQGMQLHSLALKSGSDLDVCTGNSLINMYSKCGCIQDSELAFDSMKTHDVMSWNSLIHGYDQHGQARKALKMFDKMLERICIIPDDSTFQGILVVCSRVGNVDKAVQYFRKMRECITPSASHYACMIDMMGRAGRLEEALRHIEEMPFEADVTAWKTLLGACALHGNLELGKFAAEKIFELAPMDSASYVLLSNLHALHGEWKEAEDVRRMMDENQVHKSAGWSWLQIHNEVHSFVARDKSHPKSASIYQIVEELFNIINDAKHSYLKNIDVNESQLNGW